MQKFKLSTSRTAHGRISGMSYPSPVEREVRNVREDNKADLIAAITAEIEKAKAHLEICDKAIAGITRTMRNTNRIARNKVARYDRALNKLTTLESCLADLQRA